MWTEKNNFENYGNSGRAAIERKKDSPGLLHQQDF